MRKGAWARAGKPRGGVASRVTSCHEPLAWSRWAAQLVDDDQVESTSPLQMNQPRGQESLDKTSHVIRHHEPDTSQMQISAEGRVRAGAPIRVHSTWIFGIEDADRNNYADGLAENAHRPPPSRLAADPQRCRCVRQCLHTCAPSISGIWRRKNERTSSSITSRALSITSA